MVSISSKVPSFRSATATCTLHFASPSTLPVLTSATLKKGDAIAVARIAGIQAAKKTSDLIPLAHPRLQITAVAVDINSFEADAAVEEGEFGGVKIEAKVDCEGKTGVEMEALTAATVAGLTMYDMLKGVDKGMWLGEGRVVRKEGGKSGGWVWDEGERKVVKMNEKLDQEVVHGSDGQNP